MLCAHFQYIERILPGLLLFMRANLFENKDHTQIHVEQHASQQCYSVPHSVKYEKSRVDCLFDSRCNAFAQMKLEEEERTKKTHTHTR